MPRKPLTLYRFRLSGHSHRVELFLSLLGVHVEMAEVELGKGEHKKLEFLGKNPFGQFPVLVDDGLARRMPNLTDHIRYSEQLEDASEGQAPTVSGLSTKRFLEHSEEDYGQ